MQKFISILAFLCCSIFCYGQKTERFHSFSYSVNKGLLQSTIGDIAIDKKNYCWISFPNGIQKFDGKNFIRIPVQPGLPDDTKTFLFQCANGDLLISHSGGISKYEIETNGFRVVYVKDKKDKWPFYFLGEEAGVVYFLDNAAKINGLNSQTLEWVATTATGLPAINEDPKNHPTISNILQGQVVIAIDNTIYLWSFSRKRLLASYQVPEPVIFFSVYLLSANEVVFNTFNQNYKWVRHNFSTSVGSPFNPGINIGGPTRIKTTRWREKQLLSVNNRLFVVDTGLQIKSEMLNFQNLPFTPLSGFSRIVTDKFGNLYLTTGLNGIVKVIANNYSIKYFGATEKAENNIISILPDKKANRILAGTLGGLLVFDTAQQLVQQIQKLPGKDGVALFNAIAKDSDGSYLLSVPGKNGGIFRLNKDLSILKPLIAQGSLVHSSSYFGNVLFRNNKEVVMQSQDYLYRIKPAENKYSQHRFSKGYVLSGINYCNSIIAHAFDELIFLNAADFKEQRRIPFPNTGDVRCYAIDKSGRIYVGCNNGIFVIDDAGKILERHTTQNGLPDNCIYAMAFDEEGLLWCSSNKGVFRMNKDRSFLQLTKEDGLQENEFNTNAVAVAEDGELFFGGVNGISSFYPAAIKGHSEKMNVFLTGVKANNQDAIINNAVYDLKSLELPYDKNALSFDFVAMGSSNPDQYIYQYRMKDIDEEWIPNDGLQTVRYSLLPGRYVFQLYASRVFDKNAKPMYELTIMITPPYWQTWWFRIGALAIIAAIIAFAVNRRNKNIYRKKLEALQAEHQLQLQRERISRDLHDNIGAYANTVLYKTELLERSESDLNRMELMSDLKFASKDIITSLRETVWALKKVEYTAEDCLIRIRNFMQTLARYYPEIHFHVHGDAPPKKELHYAAALNAVRIAQEIITNGIKHSGASVIHLKNMQDNERWAMTFTDDGKGFDETTVPDSQKGEGLANLRKRASESGFDIVISSESGLGTTITVSIP